MQPRSRSPLLAPADVRADARRFWVAFNDAWRGVTRKEIAWTMAIAITFTIARAYSLALAPGRGWPFPVRIYEWFYAPASVIFLVAFRFAEHRQLEHISRLQRYVIAISFAALLCQLLMLVGVPLATSEKFHISGSSAYAHGMFLALLVSVIAAMIYASLARARRAQAAFDAAALQRAEISRRVTAAQLAVLQAQVDPTLLFSTLELIENLYERDASAAERALAHLIDYLRTALPRIGEEGSTLERELQLARAYLGIAGARMGSRLEARIEIAEDVETTSFPAMVLVPLVEHVIRHDLEPLPHGGRLEIRAERTSNRLKVIVTHTGVDGDLQGAWLDPLRERLMGLYGDAARLTVANVTRGTATTFDVPFETPLPVERTGGTATVTAGSSP
jgi:LytS/YehU family sensor histidine kinase